MRERQEKNPSECQVFFCDNNEGKDTCETENISFSILDRGALLVGPNWLTLGMQSNTAQLVFRRLFATYQLHWYIFRYWWQREFCTFNGTLFDFIFKHCHFLLLQWKGAKYDQRYIDHIWIDRSTHDWLETLQKTNVICCFLFRFLIWVFPQNSVKMTNVAPYRLLFYQFPLTIQRIWCRDKYAKCSPYNAL